MIKVKRNNRVLNIPENDLNHYLSLGYSQIDNEGNVLKKTTLLNPTELLKENEKLNKELITSKNEVKKLKNEIKSLKDKLISQDESNKGEK